MISISTFLFFVLCSSQVGAKIEWKFTGADDTFTLTDFSIGTPGQSFETTFTVDTLVDISGDGKFNNKCFGFWTFDKEVFGDGFDRSGSSTLRQSSDGEDIAGIDTFSIKAVDGSDQILEEKWFNMVHEFGETACNLYDYDLVSFVSFGYNHAGKSEFFDHLLSDEKDKTAVILYDSTPVNNGDSFTGLLTFGERPSVCSNKWTTVDVLKLNKPSQWSFNLDKFSVGKFAAQSPGIAFVYESSPIFALPDAIYSVVVDILGVDVNEDWLPCNVTQNIVFTVGGVDLILTPEDYLVKNPFDGRCFFNGINTADEKTTFDDNQFSLPYTLFNKRCLLYDLENKQISFSNRIDK